MKKIKRIAIVLLGCMLVMAAGCGNTATNKSDDIGKAEEVSQVSIKPIKAKIEEGKKMNTVKVTFEIKNKGKSDYSIAAPDFVINDGDKYYYMTEGINFSEVLKPNQEVEGNGYYEIPKDLDEFQLQYIPLEREDRANWKVKLNK